MPHRFGHVALIGPTNAGKSTFVNRVVGQKVSIVSPKPQTTRNRITGILTTDEAQIVFLDTPGLHRQTRGISPLLLRSAWNALPMADVVLLFFDAKALVQKPHLIETETRTLVKALSENPVPILAALNKVDQVRPKELLLPVIQALAAQFPQAEVFPVSALTGQGVDELVAAVTRRLPEGPAMYAEDEITTAPMRFLVAEAVREKLFLALGQELPYGLAVEIESWDELTSPGLPRISAVIYVAKQNHKGIVIGKGGEVLKKVGSEARAEIEELLGGRAHLELWVKVKPDWPGDKGFVREMGLGE
ncbi:GTPase Era [Desulfolutivibrio sulfoxidireducens]|uniref:GTPase Era n=1 Tax=Desulfolutivibrio sulfoxidireducens TaxID=2773299 RepID=UPI00159DC4BC|nr:GTPase Era [Desulfolutivibrio sulfoxidireducens]QLA14708.1 GTPase Era [Desulfolutivibrio sulfoxidireducens]QLA18290.1 GTPase Era [Desulfolutivibrio sulfoxidireducens]